MSWAVSIFAFWLPAPAAVSTVRLLMYRPSRALHTTTAQHMAPTPIWRSRARFNVTTNIVLPPHAPLVVSGTTYAYAPGGPRMQKPACAVNVQAGQAQRGSFTPRWKY